MHTARRSGSGPKRFADAALQDYWSTAMSLERLADEPKIQRILTHPDDSNRIWKTDLDRFLAGDVSLTRSSAGESAIMAVQRLMIFLGYSTSSTGAFTVDGDFGPGTNRGVAQFKVENGLGGSVTRTRLCYPCVWNTAKRLITNIPNSTLTGNALTRMLETALQRIARGDIVCGSFEDAIFHLNALHKGQFLNCRQILDRYGDHVETARAEIQQGDGVEIRPEWILAIIRQETSGVIRPRFEQHWLSKLNALEQHVALPELRMRSMSMGLGQIMGFNFRKVGAASASELYTAPVQEQVAFVARFLKSRASIVGRANPGEQEFRAIAKYYNGSGYEAHRYHEKLERWFREFSILLA
jgi:peptidoglycan hydrolase-like protein with peptidoglycan-binding domain